MVSAPSRPPAGSPPSRSPCAELPRGSRVPLSVHATFCSARRYTKHMDFSIISQIDGLAYSLAGVRIERDVLAASGSVSYSPNYGMLQFECCSSFFGLYFTAPSLIPEVVLSAAMCRACGVFIVPIRPGAAPFDDKGRSWFDLLMAHSLLTFPLSSGTAGFGATYGVQAVLASFDFVGRLKSKRRPERRFPVSPIPRLDVAPFQVGVLPVVITRVSPEEACYTPSSSADRVAASAPLPAAMVSDIPPSPRRSPWSVSAIQGWLSDYPCPRVKELALHVAAGDLDPFVGDLAKHVPRPNGVLSENEMLTFREKFMENVAEGRMWGPSTLAPFPAFRTCNPFGWTPSEWGWQMLLAALLWHLRGNGCPDVLAYVDNFFHFIPPSDEFTTCCRKIDKLMADAGVSLHERVTGSVFKGLGWIWHIDTLQMECPKDKFDVLCSLLLQWAAAASLSLTEVRRAVGLMYWLSAGFCLGHSEIGHLVHMRTKGERILKSTGRRPAEIMLKISAPARAVLSFWSTAFPRWDRFSPIQEHFGPAADWEILGRVDASTDWACGGFLASRGGTSLPWFSTAWTASERDEARVTCRESTGFLECCAILHWLQIFVGFLRGRRVLLETDSSTVVYDVDRAYSPRPSILRVITEIRHLCVSHSIILRVRYIHGSTYNALADALSHNDIPLARALAIGTIGCPLSPDPSLPSPQ